MTAIQFADVDPWTMINSIRGGAGLRTCGKKSELHDDRPYGIALSEAYPLLRELCRGAYGVEHQAECLQLYKDAADRGSMPMAIVAVISSNKLPLIVKRHIYSKLSPKQQAQIIMLADLARTDPDYFRLFPKAETLSNPLRFG